VTQSVPLMCVILQKRELELASRIHHTLVPLSISLHLLGFHQWCHLPPLRPLFICTIDARLERTAASY